MSKGEDVLKALVVLFVAAVMIRSFAEAEPLFLVALAAIGGIGAVAVAVWRREVGR